MSQILAPSWRFQGERFSSVNYICVRPTHAALVGKIFTFYHKSLAYGEHQAEQCHAN